MSNLVDIQSQIEKLQKQASQIRAKEFHKTVAEIREKMHAFGITVKDLQPAKISKNDKAGTPVESNKKSVKTAVKKPVSTPVAAKFRGPDGQTWTGRGLSPRWMKMLLDQGHAKEEFLIAVEGELVASDEKS